MRKKTFSVVFLYAFSKYEATDSVANYRFRIYFGRSLEEEEKNIESPI